MLDRLYNPKLNGLNLLRLVLASGVIFWHAFPLSGTTLGWYPIEHFLEGVFVDGFFAISGFLILSSWERNPRWGQYLTARVLRIFPGFWVCLIMTAAVIAPLGIWLSGHVIPDDYPEGAVWYVLGNSLLTINHYDIAGTPTDVPYPGVWNGSLWTLRWEFLCYLGILVLGLMRLTRFRITSLVLFVGLTVALVLIDLRGIDNYYLVTGARFGLVFAAGMLIHKYRARVPVRWWLIVIAAVLIVASIWLPDYRVLAALPIAYLLLSLGALIKAPRLRLPNDLSYGIYIYGMPIQQVLALFGVTVIGPMAYGAVTLICTVPVAAASWFLVEKRALRFKGKRRQAPPETVQELVAAD